MTVSDNEDLGEPLTTSCEAALGHASVPTLLMCLAQLTEDDKWLAEPYLPVRDTQLFADESGGLSEHVQDEVRREIATVLAELESGERRLPAEPGPERLVKMMSVCLGEEVGEEYAAMFMEEMGIRDRDVHWADAEPGDAPGELSVLVIGAGLSGVLAAVKLARLGIDFQVMEKNPDLGGTWFENTYPECGVDTPNHFYSYSFETRQDWTRYFSKRDEILGYIRSVADRYSIRERITFDSEVTRLDWDEAAAKWVATIQGPGGSRTVRARTVITGVGQLNRPKISAIPGLASFTGSAFHSARWPRELDLRGKRVAVIGTGASAVQLLRSVAARAAQVTVYQRSPQWIKPSPDYHRLVIDEAMWCIANIPYYERWYRFQLFWRFGDGLLKSVRRDPHWPFPDRSMNQRNERHRLQMVDYIRHELRGREDLLAKTVPGYPPYGKRILVDNDWYRTLRRDNVELVTEAVSSVDGQDVVTDTGARRAADVLILATGFEAGRMLWPMEIRGRSGRPLSEVWGEDDPRAYLGVTMPDYPNLFCLYGPNTNLAHGGSVIFQVECQVRYITSCLTTMCERGIATVEVRRDVHDEYNDKLDAEHSELVWAHPGVTSWYRNAQGRVFSPMPWRMVDYWAMTHDVNLEDYLCEGSWGTREVARGRRAS
jgi:4-hydroxyacetophenone monooxygenase